MSRLYAVFFKSCNALCMNSNAWQSTQGRPGERYRRRHHCHSMEFGVWEHRGGIFRDIVMPGENTFYQVPTPACVQSQGCLWTGLCLSVCKCVRASKSTRVFCCVCFSEHSPGLSLPGAVCLQPPASPLKMEKLKASQTWVKSQLIH